MSHVHWRKAESRKTHEFRRVLFPSLYWGSNSVEVILSVGFLGKQEILEAKTKIYTTVENRHSSCLEELSIDLFWIPEADHFFNSFPSIMNSPRKDATIISSCVGSGHSITQFFRLNFFFVKKLLSNKLDERIKMSIWD